MQILFVHQGYELYGSDLSFLQTLEIVKNNSPSIKMSAVIPRSGSIFAPLSMLVDEVIIEDVGAITLSHAKRNPISSIFKILKASFKAWKKISDADLVYINTIVPFGYLVACLFTRKPVVIHVREIPSVILAKIFSLWFRIIGANLIFNSYATRNSFGMEFYKKGCVVQNGTKAFPKHDTVQTSNGYLKLLIIGRISPRKGLLLLLEAIAKLEEHDRKKIILRIVGGVPEGQSEFLNVIDEYVKKNNLHDVVQIFAFDKEPSKHFSWSDIVVVPSALPEPFGRVAAEAMSVSKAVIASDHGGLSEIVVNSETGWLVKPNDVESLATAIKEALADGEKVKTFGIAGRKRYTEFFSNEIYERNFLKYFDKIINMKVS